jgi:hypothetical protein
MAASETIIHRLRVAGITARADLGAANHGVKSFIAPSDIRRLAHADTSTRVSRKLNLTVAWQWSKQR